MPRRQIANEEDLPLNNLGEMDKGNNHLQPNTKTSRSGSTVSSVVSGRRILPAEDDDEDNVKDEEVTTNWDLLVYYARNSTMHGIPSIVGSELYRGRHIFWIVIVCVMAIFLGTVIYWQMSDYYDYPTVTSVNIAYVKENDFPAITVCSLNVFDVTTLSAMPLDDRTLYHMAKLTDITGLYQRFLGNIINKHMPEPPVKGNITEDLEGFNQFLGMITKRTQDAFACSWGSYYWTDCHAVNYRLTDMGLCFTIDVRRLASPKKNSTKDMPAVGNAMRGMTLYTDIPSEDIPFRLYMRDGFKIVLHDPDQEPLPSSTGFVVPGNVTAEVEISKNVKIGLPLPYAAFGSGTCVDTEDSSFENPLHRYQTYTKEACEHECFIDFTVAQCGGCRHFLHPGNETLCEIDHLANCSREAEREYYGGSRQEDSSTGNSSRSGCSCPMPCKDIKFKAVVTTAPFRPTQRFVDLQQKEKTHVSETVSYIHLFFSDPVVTTVEQVPVYSTEGLLGNVGGQIGLFMGFSLVTVAETLELLFLLATRGRKVDEHVKKHKEAEKAAAAAGV